MKMVPVWSFLQHFRMLNCIVRSRGGECLFTIAQIGKNCLRGELSMLMFQGHRTDCGDSGKGTDCHPPPSPKEVPYELSGEPCSQHGRNAPS
jgi:hypothetical protein